jgi:hypothetical protein
VPKWAKAGENGYPIAEHVERTYTGVLTVKDAANFLRRKLADADAALNAAMNEAVRRMYFPNQD